MSSNLIITKSQNEVLSNIKSSSTPPCKPGNSSTPIPSSSKTSKFYTEYSAEKTSPKPLHRKTSSLEEKSLSLQFSTPCKSRLDFNAIPVPHVDIRACKADI